MRGYDKLHPEDANERKRRWAEMHTEQCRTARSRWEKSQHGKVNRVVKSHNRRMKLNGIEMTTDTVLELKAEYGGLCPYCNAPIVRGQVDHVAPVSDGGTNERNNLAWVCAVCNRQKSDKSLLQFMLYRRNLEGASQ
jgi:5-methylcytosine-specific restriction endonuclease McrA